jgi:hypothetical protein
MAHSIFSNPPKPEPIPRALCDLAGQCGYFVQLRTLVHRRGWPERSTKPYALYLRGGAFLASFATIEQLERNLRGRAAC